MIGSLIVAAYYALPAGAALTFGQAAFAMAINFAVSSIVSKAFAPTPSTTESSGVRQQVPPSSSNSIPILYGDVYTSGTFVDAVLSTDNKTMYYVMSISHVSPNGQFGFDIANMYWGDRKVVFDGTDQSKVVQLVDGAGNVDTKISGNLYMYFYRSNEAGIITPVNTTLAPSSVMGGSDLDPTLRWPSTNRQMNGLAFAIIKLNYNQEAQTTSMQSVTFHVAQYLNGTGVAKPGDVWYDFMVNDKYGCAMDASIVNATSATELNTYSDQTITYVKNGVTYTQPRYRINGIIDTAKSCLENINSIVSSCDSWNQYDEVSGQWSVIINKAESSSYSFDDSNIIGEIRVSAFDITSSINQIQAQFNDQTNRDQVNYVYLETPSGLMYPNEPVNKLSLTFDLVNDSVQAQYLANRLLEQAREDLIVSFKSAYPGIQVEAGDVVSVTNENYGWTNKLFRVMRVTESSLPDGTLAASFELNEYSADVYNDADITQYAVVPNSNLPDPSSFGTLNAPTVLTSYPYAAVPTIVIQPSISTGSFVTYAEIWYSAFATPTPSQMYLAGTTSVPSNGVPYVPGDVLPTFSLSLPAGNWYFFDRMVNPVATSKFSSASSVLNWRPTTFQYTERYVAVAYATSITGAGFSLSPSGKTFYGLYNVASANPSTNPSDYTWYDAGTTFGSGDYVLYCNRSNRKFSFSVGNAAYANLTGAFVPTVTSIYDPSIWAALEAANNIIDLDMRTGQLTQVGTTSVSSADGLLSVTNNTNGSMVVSLEKFLNFGAGVYTKTVAVSSLTIDIYGRVVGFTQPDTFYYTETAFTATAGQTSFSVTHVVGQALVFRDGVLLSTSDYTETSTTIVMNNACVVGETVVVIYCRAVSTSDHYENMRSQVYTVGSSSIVYTDAPYQIINAGDKITFDNTGTPTQYTVSTVNTTTKTITFTTSLSGVTAGMSFYRFRAASASYAPFSRVEMDVTAVSTITPTEFSIASGFEMLFTNGSAFNEIDYDVSGFFINGFPAPLTGKFIFIQFAENNYGVPCSNIINSIVYSTPSALSYAYPNNPLAFNLYVNGALFAQGSGYDYTANSAGYTLATAIGNNYTLLNQQTFGRDGAA